MRSGNGTFCKCLNANVFFIVNTFEVFRVFCCCVVSNLLFSEIHFQCTKIQDYNALCRIKWNIAIRKYCGRRNYGNDASSVMFFRSPYHNTMLKFYLSTRQSFCVAFLLRKCVVVFGRNVHFSPQLEPTMSLIF